MDIKPRNGKSVHGRGANDRPWDAVANVLRSHYFEPDVQAARVLYSAVAAHDLDGQPVWPMLVAPPGSGKTELLEGVRDFPNTHLIDTLTPNTLLSGQIVDEPKAVSPSLLDRIGTDGILIIPDFSTVLSMRRENRATILAQLRRIFDGHFRREFGTTEDVREWAGRLTVVVAATPDVDRNYSIFQTLGERFVMVRWQSPRGIDAALRAMNQDHQQARADVRAAVGALFGGLSDAPVLLSEDHQRQIAALTEVVVKARTHVARDTRKEMIYEPEPEGATRLAQQLCQLAKGSARIGHRTQVTRDDLAIARRAGLDSIPTSRRRVQATLLNGDEVAPSFQVVGGNDLPRTTQIYASQDLEALGLLMRRRVGGYVLSKDARNLMVIAGLETQ